VEGLASFSGAQGPDSFGGRLERAAVGGGILLAGAPALR
jgi:hypothetical protein